jgi:hypothetical protein
VWEILGGAVGDGQGEKQKFVVLFDDGHDFGDLRENFEGSSPRAEGAETVSAEVGVDQTTVRVNSSVGVNGMGELKPSTAIRATLRFASFAESCVALGKLLSVCSFRGELGDKFHGFGGLTSHSFCAIIGNELRARFI